MTIEDKKPATTQKPTESVPGGVKLKTENLQSSYANFCNANSTKEEVVLNFGINNTWDRPGGEAEIDLRHRIVLSPFAAKRLSDLLQKLVTEYESRHGSLK
jgi:hypothetical protein